MKTYKYTKSETEINLLIETLQMTRVMVYEQDIFTDYWLVGLFSKDGKSISLDLVIKEPKTYDILISVKVGLMWDKQGDFDPISFAKYQSCVDICNNNNLTLELMKQFREYFCVFSYVRHKNDVVSFMASTKLKDIPSDFYERSDMEKVLMAQNSESYFYDSSLRNVVTLKSLDISNILSGKLIFTNM
ncbi:MAG: hypothetical protein ACR2M6_02510 [Vampirovibrionia bacterium]